MSGKKLRVVSVGDTIRTAYLNIHEGNTFSKCSVYRRCSSFFIIDLEHLFASSDVHLDYLGVFYDYTAVV